VPNVLETAANSPAFPLSLLAAVLAVDVAGAADVAHLPLIVNGLLDEVAHLATACLLLLAALGWTRLERQARLAASALTASVVIDVDHVPLYAGLPHISAGGRPFSHSLVTVAASLLLAGFVAAHRDLFLGASLGIGLHFVRDLATGPGLPLWWPASNADVSVPYWLYLLGILATAAAAILRGHRRRQSSTAPHPPALTSK
jgi:inner membrane protein